MESMSWYALREPDHMIPNDGGGANDGGLLEIEDYDIYDSVDGLTNEQRADRFRLKLIGCRKRWLNWKKKVYSTCGNGYPDRDFIEPDHMIPNDGGGANDGGLLEIEDYGIYDSYEQRAVCEAYDINHRRKHRR
nr:hypothetical protein [Tanacetum cinerariifolium]